MIQTEKFVFITSLSLMSLFFVAILGAGQIMKTELPGCLPDGKLFDEGQVIDLDPHTYQVYCVAKMWAFDPAVIEIPRGSEVDFYLTSVDVVHGLYIENTNVNLMAIPGNIAFAKARFKEPGVYRVMCHEYCGTNHQYMQANIIVK